jgi:UDPglucose--hexose-1-phosphate uridylyltransferase
VAPSRAERPDDAGLSAGTADPAAWCPFCAGNEACTPTDVLRIPAGAEAWRARIIPNRYPVVAHVAEGMDSAPHDFPIRPAHGVHEVVIESPAHERSILALDPRAWRDVWELCRRRMAALADRDDLAWAMVFKNSGPRAGASLEHLHSQLVALDFVPPFMQAELAAAEAATDPFGDLLRAARSAGRIVAEAGGVVALVPPAPRQPYETWLVPTDPEPFLHATTPARIDAVAELTRMFVARLDQLVAGADYNWWLHQLPFGRYAAPGLAAKWHWHLEILPRLSPLAGFELGTGCHVTTVSPQDSARRLGAG